MTDFKKIIHKKKLLAIIINEKKYFKSGVDFVTPNFFPLQVGFMNHKANTMIKPHTHKNYLRKIYKTTEVLFIKKGSLRVDFYHNVKKYLFSNVVKKDHILIIVQGSHGFKALKNCLLIEVKQGPFSPHLDKTKFKAIDEKSIKIKK
jgi:hypothetical protein